MPFLHIRSLPIPDGFDPAAAVTEVSVEFAREAGVDEAHVTVTWQRLDAYAAMGETAATQPADSHPVLIDLFAPDFNDEERVERMLEVAATAVARAASVDRTNVFASFRPARSGEVLERGEIARW